MGYDNVMKVEFLSKSTNEGFARVAVASFVSQLDPTIEELSEIKTAVSEAVTNSIEHGYNLENTGEVEVIIKLGKLDDMTYFWVQVIDQGIGIEDIGNNLVNIKLCIELYGFKG